MRLVTFREAADAREPGRLGVLISGGDEVLDIWRALVLVDGYRARPASHLEWFDLDGPWLASARLVAQTVSDSPDGSRAARKLDAVLPRASVRLLAPVPRPGKIICVGLNYRDHAAEAKMDVPPVPVLFAKFASAVIGTDDPIVVPRTSTRVDYEAELAVVAGRRMKHASPAAALAGVVGYTNANDVSARDFQKLDGQWVRSKSCDTFAPMGPALVTCDEVPEPGALRVAFRLNGVTLQDSCTDQLVFDVPHLLAFISETATLEPGDVVLTGTPPGVGFARRPAVYLKAGDVAEVEIGNLGVLGNRVVAEDGA